MTDPDQPRSQVVADIYGPYTHDRSLYQVSITLILLAHPVVKIIVSPAQGYLSRHIFDQRRRKPYKINSLYIHRHVQSSSSRGSIFIISVAIMGIVVKVIDGAKQHLPDIAVCRSRVNGISI